MSADILFSGHGLHPPLTRQSTNHARERVGHDTPNFGRLGRSVGATLMPLVERRCRPASSRPSVSMPTTRRSRCSTSARPELADYGPIFAAILSHGSPTPRSPSRLSCKRIDELLPWNWKTPMLRADAQIIGRNASSTPHTMTLTDACPDCGSKWLTIREFQPAGGVGFNIY
jgi:hypothetical protein